MWFKHSHLIRHLKPSFFFIEIDESGLSNWNASNIENLKDVNNQHQQRQNSTRNQPAQRRR